jgi:hypothetical protein
VEERTQTSAWRGVRDGPQVMQSRGLLLPISTAHCFCGMHPNLPGGYAVWLLLASPFTDETPQHDSQSIQEA